MTEDEVAQKSRCEAQIEVRDTYRYTGRGKSGFSMHYNKQRCSRSAVRDGLCKQHAKIVDTGMYVLRWRGL